MREQVSSEAVEVRLLLVSSFAFEFLVLTLGLIIKAIRA